MRRWGGRRQAGELGDPHGAARYLIAQLGVQASSHATLEALKARRVGNPDRMNEWLWIAGAIREILRSDPEPDAAD